MTTSTIRVIRPQSVRSGLVDRLAVSVAAALVSWTNRRAERAVMSHERRANAIEQELALIEREREAFRIHEFH